MKFEPSMFYSILLHVLEIQKIDSFSFKFWSHSLEIPMPLSLLVLIMYSNYLYISPMILERHWRNEHPFGYCYTVKWSMSRSFETLFKFIIQHRQYSWFLCFPIFLRCQKTSCTKPSQLIYCFRYRKWLNCKVCELI